MDAPTTPERNLAAGSPPETVTAATPRDGLGVSRRPEERPTAVEEAGRVAAGARLEAPAEVAAEAPAPSRSPAAGQQGQGGSSQGSTRGGGDGTEGGGSPGAHADFAALVAARLARAKQYPGAAQARRMQGTGVVRFSIDAAGRVTAARLDRSTGHALLDEAIMRTLRRASLPAIPETLGLSRMEFSVPIAFSLR
jgi:protein TonB